MTAHPDPASPRVRLGVLDIGSNTVHLLVVDAVRGARPTPAASSRTVVRLMRYLDRDGALARDGERELMAAVDAAMTAARKHRVEELLVMATSALREATNGPAVLAQVRERVGADVQVLSGVDEARLTFLAARRWYGWVAGRLLVLDIGGGSLELAAGLDEDPELAVSLPLGAGRTTMAFLTQDPPTPAQVEALRRHARQTLAPVARRLAGLARPDHVVGTSKTLRSLARLAGAAVEGVGPDERWRLRRDRLADWVPRLAQLGSAGRRALPGVSAARAYQILGGAVVAEEAMRALDLAELEICPWALREGAILRRLDQL